MTRFDLRSALPIVVALFVAAFAGIWLVRYFGEPRFAPGARPRSVEPGPREPWRMSLAIADVAAGETLAMQGKGDAVPACSGCHGAKDAPAGEGIPRIAGVGAGYLMAQLVAYADGTRQNEVMTPMARALSPGERANAAAWYATLPPQPLEGGAPPGDFARGLQLDRFGDEALAVQACGNCHGPLGAGGGPRLPPLAGQPRDYLVGRLEWYAKAPETIGEGALLMRSIATRLGEADRSALAGFYAALPASAAPRR